MIALAQYNAFLMRGRYGSADAVEAAKNQVPIILCKPNRPMERARNGARYFRNPPQPHMCIQDFIEDTNEPCFINVLSWQKISTPRKPEDPIPLYGGMRVPHNSSAAMTLSSHFGAKVQPVIFAVMANPEILRLSGKTAPDPSDRDALVELMIDFVEAMNPDVRFKREFTVLRDRDLAGELKDIWLAVQAKRERERGENGRKEAEKFRENKEDQWREEIQQRDTRNSDQEEQKVFSSLVHEHNREYKETESQEHFMTPDEVSHCLLENIKIKRDNEQSRDNSEEVISPSSGKNTQLSTTPSFNPLNTNTVQYTGATSPPDIGEDSIYSFIRSHYEEDFLRTQENSMNITCNSGQMLEYTLQNVYSDTCISSTHEHTADNSNCSESANEDSIAAVQAGSNLKDADENNATRVSVECNQNYFATFETKLGQMIPTSQNEALNKCKPSVLPNKNKPYDCNSHPREIDLSTGKKKDFSLYRTEHSSVSNEGENILSRFSEGTRFLNDKAQVPNVADHSHEDLLPALSDSVGAKFPRGTDHNSVAIP